jgi:voltage-gated potassium channel
MIHQNVVMVEGQAAHRSVRRKVYDLLDPRIHTGWPRFVNAIIITLIILNTLAVILETVDYFHHHYVHVLHTFDLISVAVFTLEYLLRVWTCVENPKFRHPVIGRLKYALTLPALIDLVAILPFYLPLLLGSDLRFMRTLRVMLFFRFLKLGRYMEASRVIGKVLRAKKEELTISFFLTLFLIMLASCLVYYTEHNVQPEKFADIPQTMWWSVCTLTTVGYGDMYPITPLVNSSPA